MLLAYLFHLEGWGKGRLQRCAVVFSRVVPTGGGDENARYIYRGASLTNGKFRVGTVYRLFVGTWCYSGENSVLYSYLGTVPKQRKNAEARGQRGGQYGRKIPVVPLIEPLLLRFRSSSYSSRHAVCGGFSVV